MKPLKSKPTLLLREGKELKLSGDSLANILNAVLDKGLPFRFRVKGCSMLPFIKEEDVVTIFPVKDSRLRYGDVVAFMNPRTGKLSIHRIISKRGCFYYLKGDNNADGDGLISENNIFGRVKKVERAGKKAIFCLGPARYAIALLSCMNIFSSFLFPFWNLLLIIKKKGKL